MIRLPASLLLCASLLPLTLACNSGINVRGKVSLASGEQKPSTGLLSVVASPQNHDPNDLSVPNVHAAVHKVEFPFTFEFTEIEGPIDSVDWVVVAAINPMDGDGSPFVGLTTFKFDCDDDRLNCQADEVEVVLVKTGE